MKPQGYFPPSESPSAHEGADLHIRNVVRAAVILAVALVSSILVLLLFFHHLERAYPGRTSEAAPLVPASTLPPQPRVQANPTRDLQEVLQLENSHLDHYDWIDRQRGVAQIPVDRAMVLFVKSYTSAGATNAAPVSPQTELQMRQQKAQESPHAP